MATNDKPSSGEAFRNDPASLPAALYGILPFPPGRETAPAAFQINREEILDARTHIAGYRFRAVPTSAAANSLDAKAKLEALRADHLASFAEHRMAVVPISAGEWRALNYRQFVTPNTVFHIAPPTEGEDRALWIETLNHIKTAGGNVAVDGKAMEGDLAVLSLANMVFVKTTEYSPRGFGRMLESLHALHLGISIAADEVASWEEYRACIEMGVQYCLGGFTATPYRGDAAHERAIIDDVLDCNLVQFLWYRVFESGQDDIDHDHRALFALANDLLSGIVCKRDFGKMVEAVQHLLEKASEHFLREEAVLTSVGYPRTAQHAALHAELREKATRLVADFKAGKIEIGPVFEFLAQDMIVKHMLGADRDFFPFLAEAAKRR